MLELFKMFILALLPIIWLVIALCGLKMEAYKASIGALLVAFVEAITIWQMSLINATTAALEGFAMAIWPIVIVIIAAVFTYNLTVHTKAMEIIKRMITSVSCDKRVLVLLIGWCFGGFLEGMAGFGVAIAIPASMLYALGFNPVTAILACLIANGCPTMFGSIGIPTTTLASVQYTILRIKTILQRCPVIHEAAVITLIYLMQRLKHFRRLPVFIRFTQNRQRLLRTFRNASAASVKHQL